MSDIATSNNFIILRILHKLLCTRQLNKHIRLQLYKIEKYHVLGYQLMESVLSWVVTILTMDWLMFSVFLYMERAA